MDRRESRDARRCDAVRPGCCATFAELEQHTARISSGWYRCQALAVGAAGFASAADCLEACLAAERAAGAERDPDRRVAALAWPIAVLVTKELRSDALEMLERALARLTDLPVPAARAEAALLLLQAVWPLGPTLRERITRVLFDLVSASPHWRIRRACVVAADFALGAGARAFVVCLAETCADPWILRRLHELLANGSTMQPRSFV